MTRSSRMFLYLVYLVMVISLGTVIGLSFRHASNVSKPPVKAQVAQKPKSTPTPAPTTKNSQSSSSAATSRNNVGSSVAGTGSSAAGQLTDTGPGDTIGLFVAVSLLSALAYRRRLISHPKV